MYSPKESVAQFEEIMHLNNDFRYLVIRDSSREFLEEKVKQEYPEFPPGTQEFEHCIFLKTCEIYYSGSDQKVFIYKEYKDGQV